MSEVESLRRRVTELEAALKQAQAHQQRVTAELSAANKLLRQSEERLKLAIAGSGGALWDEELDPDAPFDEQPGTTFYSADARRLVGDEAKNGVAEHYEAWHRHVLPEDQPGVLQRQRDHFEGRIPHLDHEYRVRHQDGSIRWIHGRSTILRDEQGRPVRWIGIDWDVTARKEAEAELHRYREHLEDMVTERNQYLVSLQATTADLISQLDLDQLLENIVQRAAQLVDTANGFLDLVDPDTGVLVPQVGLGVLVESLKHRSDRGHGLAGTVWQTGTPLIINNYDEWAGRIERFPTRTIHSIIGVPLLSGERVIGVLGLAYADPARRFGQGAVDMLTQFARLATLAIENARLFAAVRANEEQLRSVVHNMPVMMDALDDKGNVVAWNRECERVTGYSAAEMLGAADSLERLYPDRAYRKRMIAELEALGFDFRDQEYTITCKDGSRRTISWSNISARFPIPGWHTWAIGVDVTERRRAEAALRQERDRAQQYLDIAGVIFVALDAAGRVTLINQKGREVFGYDQAEMIGQNWFQRFLPVDVAPGARAMFARLMAGDLGPLERTENPILTSSGERRLITWHNTVIRDHRGHIVGTLSSGEDITERTQAEAAEREQRALATALVETAKIVNSSLHVDEVIDHILAALLAVVPHDGANLMLITDDRRGIYVARSCECYVERSLPDPVTGVVWPLETLPHLREMIAAQEARVIPDTTVAPTWQDNMTSTAIRSYVGAPIIIDGQVIGILNADSVTPGFFEAEHAVHLSAFANQAAVALRNAQLYQRLASYNEDLEQAVAERTAKLERLSRLKDEFVSNVSHELRTPISSIKMQLSMLNLDPTNQQTYVQRLEREADRLNDLIEDLLRLSRLDQNRVKITMVAADLNNMAHQLVADRISIAEQHGLRLHFEPNAQAPPVIADAGLIEQVLSILLTNAFNYTPAGGQVRVRVLADHEWAGFEVEDSGPGISMTEQTQLFTRFFRGEAGRNSRLSGTGLGLAIAKEIIERHQGHISVESTPGEGSVFRVLLPVINRP